MARFSLFPFTDTGQRLRVRRYMIAAATSVMFMCLLTLCFLQGVLSVGPFALASLYTLVSIVIFYGLFRSGWNKRATDRSLTVPMMLCATAAVTFVLFHVGPARPVFLLMYPVILFFGVFRLRTPSLLVVASLALTGYVAVIWMLLQTRPALASPQIEMLQWIVLAAVLIWFSFMGGYVNQLHMRLKEAEYDEVTGIFTRRRILQVLERERIRCDRGGGPLCIGMLDIDRFKEVNDSLGHAAGDQALRNSVRLAQQQLRLIDFIGRYGGEEFLLVLTQTELEGANECAERIREKIEGSPFAIANQHRHMTVSIGVAQYRPGESVQAMLERVDAALYRAKAKGRNRIERG
jgi:diguanylate cyclase (GGDEF)-like protein